METIMIGLVLTLGCNGVMKQIKLLEKEIKE